MFFEGINVDYWAERREMCAELVAQREALCEIAGERLQLAKDKLEMKEKRLQLAKDELELAEKQLWLEKIRKKIALQFEEQMQELVQSACSEGKKDEQILEELMTIFELDEDRAIQRLELYKV